MGNTAATKARSQIAASKNELVKLIWLNSAVCFVSCFLHQKSAKSYTNKIDTRIKLITKKVLNHQSNHPQITPERPQINPYNPRMSPNRPRSPQIKPDHARTSADQPRSPQNVHKSPSATPMRTISINIYP